VHQIPLTDADLVSLGSLTVTTPARTVVDCADHLSFPDAVVIADDVLGRGAATTDMLQAALHRRAPRRKRRAERVLMFADGRSESPGESLSRVLFAEHGLPTPDLQVEILHGRALVARVDFLWPELGVIGEFDGRVKYRNDPSALWHEKVREDRLRDLGYEVVRFTWDEVVRHPERVVARIRSAFARAQQKRQHSANVAR
jgi:hypothetical protein